MGLIRGVPRQRAWTRCRGPSSCALVPTCRSPLNQSALPSWRPTGIDGRAKVPIARFGAAAQVDRPKKVTFGPIRGRTLWPRMAAVLCTPSIAERQGSSLRPRDEDAVKQVDKSLALLRSRPLPGATHPTGRGRLERVGPMIHELIALDLVSRSEAGTFVLREDVQERLSQVWTQRSQSTPQVFIGRPCDRCHVVGVTRLVDESRICADCRGSADTSSTSLPVAPPPSRGRHAARKRHRAAS